VALFGRSFEPFDANKQVLSDFLQGPSSRHLLGTDKLGRDILSRLIEGCHVSLLASLEASAVAAVAGIPLGLAAGYLGGWLDAVLNRCADALLSIPGLVLAVGVIGVLGAGLSNAMIAVGIILAPAFFRIARATAADLRRETFVTCARSLGCSDTRLLARHLLPNASGPLLVQLSFSASLAIVAEASLSFLGLGVKAPQASLGSMVNDGYQSIQQTTWPIVAPSILIMMLVLALFFVGDGLESAVAGRSEGR
jgi:peptide/nickel transport system permease protein